MQYAPAPWQTHFAILAASVSVAILAGCRREAELTYTPSQEVKKLPAEQQEEISQLLTQFYGTPSDPRLMVLSGEPPHEANTSDVTDLSAFPLTPRLDAEHLKLGAAVYRQRCEGCHGVTGDGNGPAAQYLNPKPRDYRGGVFKFTSTGRNKPRKADLLRTVKYGARGTAMPSFRWLSDEELSAVVDYVILLAQRGETEEKLYVLADNDELEARFAVEDEQTVYQAWKDAPSHLIQPATPPPPVTEDLIEKGRHEFLIKGCAKCHGANAQGFTQEPLKDDWGNKIYAANLTSGMLHGGRRDIDVYRRIYSGIYGTPMPAFGPDFSTAYEKDPEKIWELVYYVLALADGREFPYVSNEEATRMAAEETAKNLKPKREAPPPDNERGDGGKPNEDGGGAAPDNTPPVDPRAAPPRPPSVEAEAAAPSGEP